MPFGLKNAPSTFQSVMNDISRPYLRKVVLVFFDDILVYSASMQYHILHLSLVLAVLRDNQFVANVKKCQFGVYKVEYLGHVVSKDGVAADLEKLSAMAKWPAPTHDQGALRFSGVDGLLSPFFG